MLMPVFTMQHVWLKQEIYPSLARRLTVIAYEDIGLANPDAQDSHGYSLWKLQQKVSAFPEARILIANVVVDSSLYLLSRIRLIWLWMLPWQTLENQANLPIPRHLRDGHYAGSKELGNAQNYKYPHNLPWQLGQTRLPAR